MIERYTLPEMGQIWSAQNRFQKLLAVEVAVSEAQARLKIIPPEAAKAIAKKGAFDVDEIKEIEKVTRHDVIAFVTNVAAKVGEYGRFVHFGLTSSDVLDTALSLQIEEAHKILDKKMIELEKALEKIVKKHGATFTAGRTHGMHAEPTTFGFKMAGFLMELRRNRERVDRACRQACVVKLSGAVGTYSTLSPDVEKSVAEKFGFPQETLATQVVPRDRHAEIFSALAILGGGYERLATEIRHLQRTEIGEAEEPFKKGQKGSSAMPHKRNPIASENVTGISRLLRSYALAAFEDIALWHERDISHSSVERVIFPDAFILSHYATDRLQQVISGLEVYEERMRENMELSWGQIYSSHVLLELVQGGMNREDAYALVQKHAHSLKGGQSLQDSLAKDAQVKKLVAPQRLKEIFSGKTYGLTIAKILKNLNFGTKS